LKKEREASINVNNRSELLGRRPHHAATPENPYAHASNPSQSAFAPAHGNTQDGLSLGSGQYSREEHALKEQNFFASANSQLDEFLDRGRTVLGDLGQQREILKGTQKRLYNVANTLGISGDTIRMVERRAKQDKWIFWGGATVFFTFCVLVIYYLR
jgi:Snare region anchored in the vesicle membrane C-terminus